MKEFKEIFIRDIIEWGVMRFAPDREHYFTLKSGRKSPYFATLANALDSGKKLLKTGSAYIDAMPLATLLSDVTVIHGPSMKGIPLAPVMVAELGDRGKNMKYAFDFKEGPEQIKNDPLIGGKLRNEKPGIKIIDVLDAGLLRHYDCNNIAAAAMTEDLYECLIRSYSLDDIDCIVGKAYGGIVPAALLVRHIAKRDGKDVRFVYDRISTKHYGVSGESNFVGTLKSDDRVLVINGHLETLGGVFGHITANDTLEEVDDVITTGKAKRESKHKVEKIHPRAKWRGVHVAVYRGEIDETGQTVQQSLDEHGLNPLTWIVDAKEIFEYAHNRNIAGKIWVDDVQYAAFQEYLEEFGVKA